jgi:hypothetical protein
MTANNDSTFVRRKFTITEKLDDVLTEMAAQNYQGNVSLCLRAAIEDHRATLEGTGTDSLAVQRLVVKLETIMEQQESVQSTVESLQDQTEKRQEPDSKRVPCSGETSGMTDEMSSIYDAIKSAEGGLRMDDLVERLDIPASQLQLALGSLVDLGFVVNNGANTHRFQLAGHVSRDSRSEQS